MVLSVLPQLGQAAPVAPNTDALSADLTARIAAQRPAPLRSVRRCLLPHEWSPFFLPFDAIDSDTHQTLPSIFFCGMRETAAVGNTPPFDNDSYNGRQYPQFASRGNPFRRKELRWCTSSKVAPGRRHLVVIDSVRKSVYPNRKRAEIRDWQRQPDDKTAA